MNAPGSRFDQPHRGLGPQILRCALSENPLVASQRLRVLLEKELSLMAATGGWLVMERSPEHRRAEAIPIIAAVGEMKMPGPVDRVRRRDCMSRRRGQEAEALIFVED